VLFPGLAIIVTALSLQLVGDGIRDLLDPRLRKSM
jgi:peptide/nickel transport system permease protein